MAEVVMSVDVDAPPEVVFAAATDWARQDEWMVGTSVRPTVGAGRQVGDQVSARTVLGPVRFEDPMEIVRWDPPRRCDVRHLGRVVRGAGAFEVLPLPGGCARFVWSEWLDLPLGLVGQVGFALARPAATAGLRASLERFAAWAPRYPPGCAS